MWKQRSENVTNAGLAPVSETVRPNASVGGPDATARVRPAANSGEQAAFSKGIIVRGEITGVDSLYIDGTVEGTIRIPGERVTVGRNGNIIADKTTAPSPCIVAREIVILGAVCGDIEASDRVEIRAHATLTGDVSTGRVSIEDGAYFRGAIDIRREQKVQEVPAAPDRVELARDSLQGPFPEPMQA